MYLILVINFKNQLNVDIHKRIDSNIIGEITNYLDEIVKQIDKIYAF